MSLPGIPEPEPDGSLLNRLAGIAADLHQDIHLWLGELEGLASVSPSEVCSAAEQERAKRFASRGDADRYLAARALLRRVLSAYVGQPPQALAIADAPDGKPFVRDTAVAFNLSHSETCVAIAVRAGAAIGVDVQRGREIDELGIARSLFAPAEIALLQGLGKDARRPHFFRIWACREAVLKAAGVGMKGRGLALRPGPEGAYEVRPLSPDWSRMRIHEFSAGRDIYGALAWPEPPERPRIRQFAI